MAVKMGHGCQKAVTAGSEKTVGFSSPMADPKVQGNISDIEARFMYKRNAMASMGQNSIFYLYLQENNHYLQFSVFLSRGRCRSFSEVADKI